MKKNLTKRMHYHANYLQAFCCLLITFFLSTAAAFAQETITGKVIEASNAGLPGVNIQVKGTTAGTVTDVNGEYSLKVAQPNAVLVFSYVGFIAQEVTVSNQTQINITLLEDTKNLEEVVVTALGIKKEARTIGYTTQEVKGQDLVKAREPNPLNSLTGKIAGLTVGPSAEMLGRPNIILRGSTDLLFVVDGVPINSDTWNVSADDIETYTVLKGPNAAALYGFRGQNGAILISTKKGSKDKRKFSVDFNSSTMFESGFVAIPKRQGEYGYGNNYQYAYSNNLYDQGGKFYRTNIWGPRFEGQNVPQYDSPVDPATGIRQGTPWLAKGVDNYKNFMETGVISTNNVSISSSGDKYDMRMSFSNNYQKGMAPNTKLNITNFNLTSGFNFSDRLRVDGSLNLNMQNSPNIPEVSSGPEGYTYIFNVYGSSSWDVNDMRDYYKAPQGKPGVQQYYAEYGRGNNPYFQAYEWLHEHQKTDIYGYAKLSYKVNDFLNLSARTQVTTWNQLRTEKLPYSAISYKEPDLRQGDYREDRRSLFENNTDIMANFNKKVLNDNFQVSALIGGNIRSFRYNSGFTTTDFLLVPGVYDFNNSKNPVRGYNFRSEMEVLSAYYSVDVTYKNFLTLSTTNRLDKLSTLPAGNNSFTYPSVALSTVVSDYVKMPGAISFLKLRASYANVKGGLTNSTIGTAYQAVTGKSLSSLIGYGTETTTSYDGPNYENQNSYNITTSLYNNTNFASFSNVLASPDLKPFEVKSYEAGLDAKFLGNRLGLDITYFTSHNGPQIFPLDVASSSGYYGRTINGVTTLKRGWEVSLTGSVLKNPEGLNWDVLANWSTYKETLKDVYDGTTNIYLAGPDHIFHVGDRLDAYYGYKFLRSPDGQIIHGSSINPNTGQLNKTGQPLVTPPGTNNKQLMGYTNPDYVWAVNNRFSYKSISFSFQFDGRVGGVILNQVNAYAQNAGNQMGLVQGAYGEARLKEWQSTASGTKAPTPAYVGEGVYVSGGQESIKYDASGNISNYSELSFQPNDKAVTVQSYVQGIYSNGGNGSVDEAYLMSKSFAKLREVTIGFTVPAKLLANSLIRSASFSLVGRNLLYFAENNDFDLDQYAQGYNGSSRSTLRNPGLQSATTRRYGFNINLTF